MFGWGKKVPSKSIANQAVERPVDHLADLTKQQIIDKLLELPWVETGRGLPGIPMTGHNEEQLEFIRRCTEQGLLYATDSHSLGGDSRCVCVPGIVAEIVKKTGFLKHRESENVRSFIIENMGDIAEIMYRKGRWINEEGSTKIRFVDIKDNDLSWDILNLAETLPALFKYPLKYSDLENELGVYSGHRYDLSEGRMGQGIAGQLYLNNKEKLQAQSAAKIM